MFGNKLANALWVCGMDQPAGAVWELCAVAHVSLCLAFEECGSHTVTGPTSTAKILTFLW